jgi:hypothetical protein
MFLRASNGRSVRSNSIMIEKTSDDLRTTYSMTIVKQLIAESNLEVFIHYSSRMYFNVYIFVLIMNNHT